MTFSIPASVRNMGFHLCAGKGSGKSRLMERVIAWQDFCAGVPVVIFDPFGQTIDNFLDKVRRLPPEKQKHAWQRVRYADLFGNFGYIECFPLLYGHSNESLYTVASRFLEVVAQSDKSLMNAPMHGLNAVLKVDRRTGVLLAAMGWQLSEAEVLLVNPRRFERQIQEAVARFPEAKAAADYFFTEFPKVDSGAWREQTTSYLRKLDLFLDDLQKALYAADAPTIIWQDVAEKRQAVLLDFRHFGGEQKRLAMLWLMTYLLDYIRTKRGATRERPLSLIIDELTFLLNDVAMKDDPLEKDMEELINMLARNANIWLCLAHQEMYQVSEPMQKALLTMGIQCFGSTMDADAAKKLGERFYPYRPHAIKDIETYENYYGSQERVTYLNMHEQKELASRHFLNLGTFRYLLGLPEREGSMAKSLRPVHIKGLDPGQFPNGAVIAEVRRKLAKRHGRPVTDVLKEIAARQESPESQGDGRPMRHRQLPNYHETSLRSVSHGLLGGRISMMRRHNTTFVPV
jgi:hypothetical protein